MRSLPYQVLRFFELLSLWGSVLCCLRTVRGCSCFPYFGEGVPEDVFPINSAALGSTVQGSHCLSESELGVGGLVMGSNEMLGGFARKAQPAERVSSMGPTAMLCGCASSWEGTDVSRDLSKLCFSNLAAHLPGSAVQYPSAREGASGLI